MLSDYSKKRDYYELAYFTGYVNGLYFFGLVNAADDPKKLPSLAPFFHPGVGEIEDDEEFDRLVRHNPNIHKGALRMAQKIVRGRLSDADVIQHLPWG